MNFQDSIKIFDIVIQKDLMPFKALFYLALEKENYEEAELIRREWVRYLKHSQKLAACADVLQEFIKTKTDPGFLAVCMRVFDRQIIYTFIDATNVPGGSPYHDQGTVDLRYLLTPSTPSKIQYELDKIENIIGLTDPMLLTLRKELVNVIKAKDWDNAQKIQNLITARVNELRPSQSQGTYKDSPAPGGQTTREVPGSGAAQTICSHPTTFRDTS